MCVLKTWCVYAREAAWNKNRHKNIVDMHRLHDVWQFSETSLKHRIVKKKQTSPTPSTRAIATEVVSVGYGGIGEEEDPLNLRLMAHLLEPFPLIHLPVQTWGESRELWVKNISGE